MNTSSRFASFTCFGRSKPDGHQFINQLVGRSQGNNFTGIYNGNAVTQYFCLIHVMRSNNNRGTTLANSFINLPKIAACLWVKTSSWLIQENDFGVLINVVAMEKRCFCPPLNSLYLFLALSRRFTVSSSCHRIHSFIV